MPKKTTPHVLVAVVEQLLKKAVKVVTKDFGAITANSLFL